MNKLHVIKTGTTFPALLERRGDFEHWILSGAKLRPEDVVISDVCGDAFLPAYEDIASIIVTGSHSMVTDGLDWIERTASWLRVAVGQRIPVLGICFGHQLLAYALGGEVGRNPNGREYGTVEVHLNETANTDGLLGRFGSVIKVHASHTQSVLKLPRGAIRLASSDTDPNQAFVVGGTAWGVQFHPEFDAEIATAYVEFNVELLRKENQDPKRLIERVTDTRYGSEILQRFAALTSGDRRAGGRGVR
ncbi:MAG: glutamine amidotransferase [Candidatus Latescibacterota bacterium]|nr:MAG: glutamine amidotransferase [Candidatus Latescibacterota bacterium]